MNFSHVILVIIWVGYCVLHSWLADIRVKGLIQKITGISAKYYRPVYSVFAFITLGLVLWFQYSIRSPRLFSTAVILYLTGSLVALSGLSIMLMCIKKYFYELSGLQELQHTGIKPKLQQTGLHQYVRHPLYFGTLVFIWGLFLIFPLLNNLIAILIITLYVVFGIGLEEQKLLLEYGELYNDYAKKVPKIIPQVYKIKKGSV